MLIYRVCLRKLSTLEKMIKKTTTGREMLRDGLFHQRPALSAVERYGTVIIIKVSVASLFYPFHFVSLSLFLSLFTTTTRTTFFVLF